MRNVIFFDRDGIVNVPPAPGGYVERPEDFKVMPEFIASLRVVLERGYEAIVITNQQGVGKGLYSVETLSEIHGRLIHEVESHGLSILDIYYCPHLAADHCSCRKPLPGMILKAIGKWDIDPAHSWMVGDSFRDVDAGVAAGCRTLLVHPERYDISTRWVRSIVEMPAMIDSMIPGEG
jgi:histidinol-phosphate phosphatase family protein